MTGVMERIWTDPMVMSYLSVSFREMLYLLCKTTVCKSLEMQEQIILDKRFLVRGQCVTAHSSEGSMPLRVLILRAPAHEIGVKQSP